MAVPFFMHAGLYFLLLPAGSFIGKIRGNNVLRKVVLQDGETK